MTLKKLGSTYFFFQIRYYVVTDFTLFFLKLFDETNGDRRKSFEDFFLMIEDIQIFSQISCLKNSQSSYRCREKSKRD